MPIPNRFDSDDPEETSDRSDLIRSNLIQRIRDAGANAKRLYQTISDIDSWPGGKPPAHISRLIDDAFTACEDQQIRLTDLYSQLIRESCDDTAILRQVLEVEIQGVDLLVLIRKISAMIAK